MHLTLSPLFHVTAAVPVTLVLGPKLGVWFNWVHASDGYSSVDLNEHGWTFGANAGLFFPVGSGTTELGMLLSYANIRATQTCITATGYGTKVHDCSEESGDANVLGMTFAALF
jgi:hypothetical protein